MVAEEHPKGPAKARDQVQLNTKFTSKERKGDTAITTFEGAKGGGEETGNSCNFDAF